MNCSRQQGFILAATLWVLAFMTVAAGFFALWTASTLQTVRTRQLDMETEIELRGTQASVLYLLATRPMSERGLVLEPLPGIATDPFSPHVVSAGPTLYLDDQPYRGLGKIRFSIQDESGLVNINSHYTRHLFNLLGLLGVPATERDALIAKLQDYTDKDNLQRLNGAEADAYKKSGRSIPTNKQLRTSWEAANILGWDEQPSLWQDNSLPRLSNSVLNVPPNFNTAPEIVLQTYDGIGIEEARRIVAARRQNPPRSLSQVHAIIGKRLLGIDPLGTAFFPSAYLRLSLWEEGGRRLREIHVQLTPVADQAAPWLVDYAINIPLQAKQQRVEVDSYSIPVFTPADAADQY